MALNTFRPKCKYLSSLHFKGLNAMHVLTLASALGYCSWLQTGVYRPEIDPFIACSHHRHGEDKTVLSCPCRRCEHNWRQDKTQVGNWVETRQNTSKLDRDKTKLSFRRCEHNWRQDKTRQFCLVLVGGVNTLLQTLVQTLLALKPSYLLSPVRWIKTGLDFSCDIVQF